MNDSLVTLFNRLDTVGLYESTDERMNEQMNGQTNGQTESPQHIIDV